MGFSRLRAELDRLDDGLKSILRLFSRRGNLRWRRNFLNVGWASARLRAVFVTAAKTD